MNYFDFHLHPTLKTTLKAGTAYNTKIPTNSVSGIPGFCTDLPQIFASQASVPQLSSFERKLVGVSLYSIEGVIAGDKLLNEVARTNKKLSKYVSVQRLQEIAGNQLKAYDYLKNELLAVFQKKPEFAVVDNNTDFSALDPTKIHVFFVLEGCHSLCNSSNTFFDKTEIIKNLGELASTVPVISVNLSHLQQSNISNHPYGIQLTSNAAFIPSGNGLSQDAEEIIQTCFDRGICVDIKHMSLIARRQLFQQVNAGKYRNPQPVICTHAGFTGIHSGEMQEYVLAFGKKGNAVKVIFGKPNHIASNTAHLQRPAPAFNASSINLYDEEIAAIVQNGGLIGLSLDRRIGGFVGQFDEDPYAFFDDETYIVDKEYFSIPEFQQLGIDPKSVGQKIDDAHCNVKEDLLEASRLPSVLEDYHRDQLMLQIKHFLQVCLNHGISLDHAQTKICIGSDFDGIINPFTCAMRVDELPKLKTFLQKNFHHFLGRYTDSRAWRSQLDIKQFTEQLFYLNGLSFIQQRIGVLSNAGVQAVPGMV
jgi:microsomal dipeptidase-like Zn-dependent dipeptidase